MTMNRPSRPVVKRFDHFVFTQSSPRSMIHSHEWSRKVCLRYAWCYTSSCIYHPLCSCNNHSQPVDQLLQGSHGVTRLAADTKTVRWKCLLCNSFSVPLWHTSAGARCWAPHVYTTHGFTHARQSRSEHHDERCLNSISTTMHTFLQPHPSFVWRCSNVASSLHRAFCIHRQPVDILLDECVTGNNILYHC